MLRWLAAAVIVGVCTLLGVNASGRSRQRVKALTGLISSLEIMKSEISSSLTPLPEIIKLLREQTREPAAELYRRCYELMNTRRARAFRETWRRALSESDSLCLLDEEEQALLELGMLLGRYEPQQQSEAIDRTQKRLELFLQLEEKEQAEKSRISAALGAGAGITLAMILL